MKKLICLIMMSMLVFISGCGGMSESEKEKNITSMQELIALYADSIQNDSSALLDIYTVARTDTNKEADIKILKDIQQRQKKNSELAKETLADDKNDFSEAKKLREIINKLIGCSEQLEEISSDLETMLDSSSGKISNEDMLKLSNKLNKFSYDFQNISH